MQRKYTDINLLTIQSIRIRLVIESIIKLTRTSLFQSSIEPHLQEMQQVRPVPLVKQFSFDTFGHVDIDMIFAFLPIIKKVDAIAASISIFTWVYYFFDCVSSSTSVIGTQSKDTPMTVYLPPFYIGSTWTIENRLKWGPSSIGKRLEPWSPSFEGLRPYGIVNICDQQIAFSNYFIVKSPKKRTSPLFNFGESNASCSSYERSYWQYQSHDTSSPRTLLSHESWTHLCPGLTLANRIWWKWSV